MSDWNDPILAKGEWVVISGSGKGIGREIALAFAKQGRNPLLLISRSEISLHQTRDLCLEKGAPEVQVLSLDLSIEKIEWPSFTEPLKVGLVINNAGQFSMHAASTLTVEQLLHDWRSNVLPAIHCNAKFLPKMEERRIGGLFHVISAAALEGRSYAASYSSAKHALLGYVRSLRADLMQKGIAVSAIHPGQTLSASWDGSDVDPNELMDAKDLARLIVSMSNFSRRTVLEEVHLEPTRGSRAPF